MLFKFLAPVDYLFKVKTLHFPILSLDHRSQDTVSRKHNSTE